MPAVVTWLDRSRRRGKLGERRAVRAGPACSVDETKRRSVGARQTQAVELAPEKSTRICSYLDRMLLST